MANIQDASTVKMVKSELNRRQIDATRADIKVFRGVVYISGKIQLHGHSQETGNTLLRGIQKCLRSRQGIKDVILDVACL